MHKFPPIVRDLLVLIAGAVLTWASQSALPALSPWLTEHQPLGPLAGALAAQLILILTPVVRDYGVGSGRHLRRPDDTGAASSRMLAAAAAVVALGAVITLGIAGAAQARAREQRSVTWLGITSAYVCDGDLIGHYGYQQLTRGTWDTVGDSWGAHLQVRYLGNGASPGGTWGPIAEHQRSEGYLRGRVASIPTWDAVRVVGVVDGDPITSAPVLPAWGCIDE